jgi:hypothetical protein
MALLHYLWMCGEYRIPAKEAFSSLLLDTLTFYVMGCLNSPNQDVSLRKELK